MSTMRAMVLESAPGVPVLREVPVPTPMEGEVLVAVACCGLCRTDLHVVDRELPDPRLPLVPGHQVVGRIAARGAGVPAELNEGLRVGIPWLGGSCGCCRFCLHEQENLCDRAIYTGYQRDGGFAEYCVADARFVFPLPDGYPDLQAAPLLCAGSIGYRAFRFCGEGETLGLYGFGAAAHILTQVARHDGWRVHAFTRDGDERGQAFARQLGAAWAGGSSEEPPEPLDAAIVFAPAGELVPLALQAVRKGGRVVCGGIHMSDIPSFPYRLLWEERSIQSVANLTRRDAAEFLALAPTVPVRTEVRAYPLEDLGQALDDLRHGRFEGAAVIGIAAQPR